MIIMAKRKVKSELDAELKRMEFLGIVTSYYKLDGTLMYGLTEKGKAQKFDGKNYRKVYNDPTFYKD
tara:strand:+ start:394 stop:594 length:201 start_codon:yes stop_codon:yes gene_type:complete